MENIEKKNISWNKNKFKVCNNNSQLQVFDVKHFLRISVNNNTPRFASGIDSDLGPQQRFKHLKPVIKTYIHLSFTISKCSVRHFIFYI